MNYTFFFLIFSLCILVLSLVVVCISPVINNATKGTWKISSWRTLNCQMYSDLEKSENAKIDDIQKYRRIKNLCCKKKAMHDLEYASLIIDIILGFVCANLSLLHYFNVGKDFEKKTGLIGLITGVVSFILTLAYICYNGDIFNNDIAYGDDNANTIGTKIIKLFPNGALCKKAGNKMISPYEGEKDVFSKFIKYKDLGKKQYNYDYEFYKIYDSSPKHSSTSCPGSSTGQPDFLYRPSSASNYPFTSNENKDLYDRWITTLILAIIIDICCIGLSVFGFLLFKSSKGDSSGEKTVPIN